VAEKAKARIFCPSPGGIAGSNPPLGHGCLVSCEVYILSGRGLCDEPILRTEESYRLWCVKNEVALACFGLLSQKQQMIIEPRVGAQRFSVEDI
jgi:hypothetical protein